MPNWMSNRDLNLQSGDLLSCKHCGTDYWVDEWHTCQGITQNLEPNLPVYKNKPKNLKTVITIEINSVDTLSLQNALSSAVAYFDVENQNFHSESDDILGYSYTIKKS
jgi:hypothetical protein